MSCPVGYIMIQRSFSNQPSAMQLQTVNSGSNQFRQVNVQPSGAGFSANCIPAPWLCRFTYEGSLSFGEALQTNNISWGPTSSLRISFLSTETVPITCLPGYATPAGENVVTVKCDYDFTGSSVPLPTCAPTACSALGQPSNGRLSATSGIFGDTITLTCTLGFMPYSSAQFQCTGSAQAAGQDWSPSLPSTPCVKISQGSTVLQHQIIGQQLSLSATRSTCVSSALLASAADCLLSLDLLWICCAVLCRSLLVSSELVSVGLLGWHKLFSH